MKKLILLSLFLLTVNSTFCQSGYPKKIVYKGDTVALFSQKQINEFIAMKETMDAYTDIIDSLRNTLDTCDTAITLYKDQIISLKSEVSLLNMTIGETNSLLLSSTEVVNRQVKDIKKLKKINKVTSWVAIIVTIALIVKLL